MFDKLLLTMVFMGFASAACISMYCPPMDAPKVTVPCAECDKCGDEHMKFCTPTIGKMCGCIPRPPLGCKFSNVTDPTLKKTSFCHSVGTTLLPPPQVQPRGSSAISITVPRFFADESFAKYDLANLAIFTKHTVENNSSSCTSIYHIQASLTGDQCLYRIRLAMPGIEHKTDDAYYYDDGTDLETELATDLFHGADKVVVWAEVATTERVKMDGRFISFTASLRSPVMIVPLRSRDSAERMLRADEAHANVTV